MGQFIFAQAIVFDIDWYYTMAWFPAALLITQRRSTCMKKMRVQFVYTLYQWRMAPCNTHNFVVYSRKHKVLVLAFLVRTKVAL